MKNKLISMLLVVAMLFAVVLTGCSAEKTADDVQQGIVETASKTATTLVMWCVTEEGTDLEQAEAVAEAMAEMTKSKYKTNLIVKYLTMDEYYEKLEAAIASNEFITAARASVADVTKKATKVVESALKNGQINAEQKALMLEGDRETLLSFITVAENALLTLEEYEYLVVTVDAQVNPPEVELDENGDPIVPEEPVEPAFPNAAELQASIESKLLKAVEDKVKVKLQGEKKETTLTAEVAADVIAGEYWRVEAEYLCATTEESLLTAANFVNLVMREGEVEDEEGEEEEEIEEEEELDEEDRYDENGNIIIDTTIYPEVEDYQVDIIYLSGYDKFNEYIENEWLLALNGELTGSSKKITNYVSGALLNAVKQNNNTYAIPNNNVIGEYTYMLIDKPLFDKYYYNADIDKVHNVSDVAAFLEDVATYETEVLPINGDIDYCLSLIADYWTIDPETLEVSTDVFSVLGHAYKDGEIPSRGTSALTFDNLLVDENYTTALTNLMSFKFKNYFGTPAEGQKSAVSFVTGDAALAAEYEDDYYVVVVDYPKAANDDIYDNMFAVSTFTSDLKKSMEVITLLNTNTEFRNLFQYGIEGTNYHLNDDGSVKSAPGNKYFMDVSKTGNEFLAYVPEGQNVEVWEYAKQQNRESLVDPLLGFSFEDQLVSEEEEARAEGASEDSYAIEVLDKELISYLAKTSADAWAKIQACEDVDSLEKVISTLSKSLGRDEKVKSAMAYNVVEPTLDENGAIVEKEDENGVVVKPTITVDVETLTRIETVDVKDDLGEPTGEKLDMEVKYFLVTKYLNPYQVYYRWMKNYQFLPAGFGTVTE